VANGAVDETSWENVVQLSSGSKAIQHVTWHFVAEACYRGPLSIVESGRITVLSDLLGGGMKMLSCLLYLDGRNANFLISLVYPFSSWSPAEWVTHLQL
jgi:hypothetical protein